MESGQAHITGDFITSLFRASTRGATHYTNWLVDGVYDGIAFVRYPLVHRSLCPLTCVRLLHPFGGHLWTRKSWHIDESIANIFKARVSSHDVLNARFLYHRYTHFIREFLRTPFICVAILAKPRFRSYSSLLHGYRLYIILIGLVQTPSTKVASTCNPRVSVVLFPGSLGISALLPSLEKSLR